MLVEMSLDTEFKIQEITMLLLLIRELRRSKSSPAGLSIEQSMKRSLFFTNKAIVITGLQEA